MLVRHDALMTGVDTPRQTTSAKLDETISTLHARLTKMDAGATANAHTVMVSVVHLAAAQAVDVTAHAQQVPADAEDLTGDMLKVDADSDWCSIKYALDMLAGVVTAVPHQRARYAHGAHHHDAHTPHRAHQCA